MTGTTYGFHYVQTKKWIYANRASGGNRYHCIADGDPDAGSAARKKTSTDGCLFVAAEAVELMVFNVHAGQRRPFHARLEWYQPGYR